jgi:outer membrane protein
MRSVRIVFLLQLLVMGCWACQASALGLEAAVNVWDQEPGGDFSYQGLVGQDWIDLDTEARYGREQRIGGRVKVDLPVLPNIYILATPMEFSGAGLKNSSFSFGGQSFAAGDFTSKLSLDHYDLGLYYGFPLLKTATLNTLNLDFGVEVRRLEVRADVTQEATGQLASVDETYYFPMGFLALQIQVLKSLALEAELRGIAYSGNHFYDLIGRVKYSLPGPVYLAGGWRHEEIELDEKDIRAELTVGGPFAELGLSF